MTTHDRRPGNHPPARTPHAAPIRSLLDPEPTSGGKVGPGLAAIAPAVLALSEGHAAAAWGRDVTRFRFHVTVPAAFGAYALALRDDLILLLRAHGLDLGVTTTGGIDVYLTWPDPDAREGK